MRYAPVYRATGLICAIVGQLIHASEWKAFSLMALCFLLAEIRDTWEGECQCD